MSKVNRTKYYCLLCTFITIGLLGIGCVPDERDAGPPTTTILNPAPGEVVTGTVPVLITASDEKNVELIRIFIDGVEVHSANGNTTTFNWDTRPIADNRDHHVSSYAIDDDNNIGPAAITSVRVSAGATEDTLPPVIAIQNPTDGQNVRGVINIVAQVDEDINNPIDSVQFYIDGTREFTGTEFPYIYPWDTSPLINGTLHSMFAVAFDRAGFISSSPVVSVTVSTNNIADITPPRVAFIFPNPGGNNIFSVSVLSNIQVVVDATDDIGVSKVEFYIDGILRGTDTTADPLYEFNWDISSEITGIDHTIYVKAFDVAGNLSVALVPVRIDP